MSVNERRENGGEVLFCPDSLNLALAMAVVFSAVGQG